MKVSAFIRVKSAKNNITDRASIYFRVRDDATHTDIKAASELTINPNHWSQERQGYKGRVMMVSEAERMQLDRSVMELTTLIAREFYIGASSQWLQQLIYAYHHPNAFKICGGEIIRTTFGAWVEKYLEARNFNQHQKSNVTGLAAKVERFEQYMQKVMKVKNYIFAIGVIDKDDIEAFRIFLMKEHEYVKKYPKLYEGVKSVGRKTVASPRGINTVNNLLTLTRTIVNFAIANGAPNKNPFDGFEMPGTLYGTPYYLTLEERDKLYNLDIKDNEVLAMYRDMFVFQCLVGCRHGDLVSFVPEDIIDGVLEYIPEKTRNKIGRTVRVPLNGKAMEILKRHPTEQGKPIFGQRFNYKYNDAIRDLLTMAGITRMVTVIDPVTRQEVKKPLNEIGSSHMARRTFIGNLYKQVKDPNLIASMSGHMPGSKAFARYRAIDDEMKQELIDLIQ